MKRIVIGAIVGGILMHAWGFLAWVCLPVHDSTINTLPPNNETLVGLLKNVVDHREGVYYFPSHPDDMSDKTAMAKFEETHRAGPVGLLVLRRGRASMPPSTILRGLLINIIGAFIASILLSRAASTLPVWWQRAMFVFAIGLSVAVIADGLNWNWMLFPTGYTIAMMSDRLIGYLLLGVFLATLFRPTSATEPTAQPT